MQAGNLTKRATPRVSVVIPTYNRARDVARCLDSLVAQTFGDFEVIVCDDGSTDATGEVVARYRDRLDVRYHWAENFGGPARPRNAGLQLARAPYAALLDSDDWWGPRKLQESVARLDAGADLVYHELYLATAAPPRFYWRRCPARQLRAPVFDDLFSKGNAICNSSVVVRRELLLRIGGFCEERSLIAWEDYDAWLRLARVTERFERIDGILGYYWAGGGNLSVPRRLIDNLESFRQRYLEDGREERAPAWYHYSLALAHHQLGAHGVALNYAKRALAAGLPMPQRLRAMFTAAASSVRLVRGAT